MGKVGRHTGATHLGVPVERITTIVGDVQVLGPDADLYVAGDDLFLGGQPLPELATSDSAKVPVSTVGGVTTLDVAKTVPEAAWITANQQVNNSTMLVNITGLVVPVEANAVYVVDGLILYTSSTVADINVGWTTPAGVSGSWWGLGAQTGTAVAASTMRCNIQTTWAVAQSVGGIGASEMGMLIRGLLRVGGTAGSLQCQFAQANLEVSNTVVLANSWFSAQRVQ